MSLSPRHTQLSIGVILSCLVGTALAACSGTVGGESGIGGISTGQGGSIGAGGGGSGTGGGSTATGRGGTSTGEGGSTGGTGTGGTGADGGSTGSGGVRGSGGSADAGGDSGRIRGSGGSSGTGGAAAGTGGTNTGGTTGSGGNAGTDGGSSVECNAAPLSGGTPRTSANAQGTAAGLNWSIWSNGTAGTITTYSTPAFSAAWNNSGDFLARLGLEWGNSGKTFDQFGTTTAQFAETKSGTAGGFSYVAIYGWSNNPCIEYYIIDDSFNRMPVNPGNTTNKGTASIDGGTYTLYTRPTTGTGGSRCAGVSSWTQYYSVRQTARQCGQISITEHFKAWAAAGMTLGTMLEAKVLVEVGGGSGRIDFTTANVTAQ